MRSMPGRLCGVPTEAVFWIIGLLYLALPARLHVLQLCPLKLLGFPYCPGCGLGESIAFLIHGNIAASLQAHPLGIPAAVILLHRICSLLTRRRVTAQVQT